MLAIIDGSNHIANVGELVDVELACNGGRSAENSVVILAQVLDHIFQLENSCAAETWLSSPKAHTYLLDHRPCCTASTTTLPLVDFLINVLGLDGFALRLRLLMLSGRILPHSVFFGLVDSLVDGFSHIRVLSNLLSN